MSVAKLRRLSRAQRILRRVTLARKRTGVHLCRFEELNVALDFSEPIHRNIYLSGDFEPELASVLKRVSRAGDVFLDIGANIGWHTLRLLAAGDEVVKAYAIEPQQRNARLITLSVSANQLTGRCEVRRLAIGSRAGKVTLKRFKGLDSMHTSVFPLGDLPFEEEEVDCESVDGLVSAFKVVPTVIKCDAEGSELSVLEGAHRTLSGAMGAPPLWFLEANYETSAMAGYFPWKIAEHAEPFGYFPYTIREHSVVPVSPKGLRHGDVLVLAIPSIHASRLS